MIEPQTNRSLQPYIESTLETGTREELLMLFDEVHPADLAEALEDVEDERWDIVLEIMPAPVFGALIQHLPAIDVVEQLTKSSPEFRKEVLAHLADDELVDLLQEIPDEERDDYVGLLPEPVKETSRKLMAFPETSAGGRMTTEIATVSETMTIRQAIEVLSEIKETSELLARIYVVDERNRLLGKVRLRDLTFNPRDKLIREVMDDDLMSIDAFADQEEAARMIARYDLLALPVVNPDREVLGVVTHDDAMEILEEEASEDIEKISGIQASDPDETYLRTSVMNHFRRRFGWVVTMAFLGIAAGFVLYKFEGLISTMPILAIYLTTVVASGGNTGSQASTMVIRAMSLGEFNPKDWFTVLWKEFRVGLMMGLLVGLCLFLQIRVFNLVDLPETVTVFRVGLTVGLALAMQITASTLLGASLPLLARLIRVDPAAVAAPVITTVVDVIGLVIYFNLARGLLGI